MKVSIKKYIANYIRRNDLMPKSMRRGKWLFVGLMIFPAILGLIVWYFIVNINSILMAFQDPTTNALSFVNFKQLFNDLSFSSSVIWEALGNTLLFFVEGSILMPVIVYFIAYFLYKGIFLGKVFRFILFVPSIVSGVVISTMFINLVSPKGPLSYLHFLSTGAPMTDYLHQDGTSIWVILAYCVWTGFTGNLLLLIGTFTRLPKEVLESARLDGVNQIQELFLIVTPMVWSTISTLFLLSMVGIFTASGPILLFTNGAYKTYTISFWIFAQVKDNASYNYPAAVGLAFTVLGLPIVFIVNKLMSKVSPEIEY